MFQDLERATYTVTFSQLVPPRWKTKTLWAGISDTEMFNFVYTWCAHPSMMVKISPRKEIDTSKCHFLLMTDVLILPWWSKSTYFSDLGKRSRQTEGIWDPVWAPKVEHFRPRRFQNPFKIILKHLISKRGGHNVKRTTIYPLEIWTPRGFPGFQEFQESSQRRPTGQNMNRFKLGAWSRVSK